MNLSKLDTYIEELDEIKEIINAELPEVRYDGINVASALKSFERNMGKLQAIRVNVQQMYTTNPESADPASLKLMQITNLLDNANLLYYEVAVEKLRSRKINMEVYHKITDYLLESVKELDSINSSMRSHT